MLRTSQVITAIAAMFFAACVSPARAQAPPVPPVPGQGGSLPNVAPTKSDATQNKIVQPVPLSVNDRQTALAGADRHLLDEVATLKNKLKNVFPDELNILAKTNGWTQQQQRAVVAALRTMDPAAVFEAWTQGSPQDTAGAEIIARQTEVKRTFARLEQSVQNKASAVQDLADLEDSLARLAEVNPTASQAVAALEPLKTWTEVRRLIETAVPDSGAIARLPIGKAPIIMDPALPLGKAIVLGNGAVMVGNHGQGPVQVFAGNAAEAMGLPVVSSKPLPAAEGQEIRDGVLLVNPEKSGANIHYTLNGNRYLMEPGMSQRLPEGFPWSIQFDKGGPFGTVTYSLPSGTYFFTPTDSGWELYKHRFDVVLDNSQNPQDFHFLMYDQKMIVPARHTRTITGMYPIVIRFDRGNGVELAAKELNFDGTAEIGVNAADNLWDLFPTDEGRRQASRVKLLH